MPSGKGWFASSARAAACPSRTGRAPIIASRLVEGSVLRRGRAARAAVRSDAEGLRATVRLAAHHRRAARLVVRGATRLTNSRPRRLLPMPGGPAMLTITGRFVLGAAVERREHARHLGLAAHEGGSSRSRRALAAVAPDEAHPARAAAELELAPRELGGGRVGEHLRGGDPPRARARPRGPRPPPRTRVLSTRIRPVATPTLAPRCRRAAAEPQRPRGLVAEARGASPRCATIESMPRGSASAPCSVRRDLLRRAPASSRRAARRASSRARAVAAPSVSAPPADRIRRLSWRETSCKFGSW
jgi:hypothetical protein